MLRLLAAALILSVIALFLALIMLPGLKAASEDAVLKAVENEVNEAVGPGLSGGLSYMDLISEYRGYDGGISAMEPDRLKIKEIADEMSLKIREMFEEQETKTADVPLTSLLGGDDAGDIEGSGPSVRIHIFLDGDIETNCNEETISLADGSIKQVLSFQACIPVKYSGPFIKGRTALAVHIASAEAVLSENSFIYSIQ